MKKMLIALVAVAPLGLAALPAAAEESEGGTACTGEPQAAWMSEDAARAKAAEAGYDVRDIKAEKGCFEIYAMKDGKRLELVMNPVDGTLVGTEGENDE